MKTTINQPKFFTNNVNLKPKNVKFLFQIIYGLRAYTDLIFIIKFHEINTIY